MTAITDTATHATFGPFPILDCAECSAPAGRACEPGCAGELWPGGPGYVWLSRSGVPHWLPAPDALCATCGRRHDVVTPEGEL
jgi:hypothetical protein